MKYIICAGVGEICEILGHLTGYFIIWTQLFAETWNIKYARWNLQPADIDILFLTRHNSEYDVRRKKGRRQGQVESPLITPHLPGDQEVWYQVSASGCYCHY